jgi:uncharacterized repeat protein (TIGR03803 family)
MIGGATDVYGTTLEGGASDLGTIFEIDASTGAEIVLHSFAGGGDGAHPYGGLSECAGADNVIDYCGTTYEGGSGNAGTVFKFDPPSGTVTILHSFTGGVDGELPQGGLVVDASWNLYGTTGAGGAHGYGTVFEVSSSGTESVLYSFTGGADGASPDGTLASVTLGQTGGPFYGTTSSGGAGYGTLFELNTNGTLSVLHTFCSLSGCADGSNPTGPLNGVGGGILRGTTVNGGAYGKGAVYQFEP